MIQISRKYQIFFKVFTVTIVLPIGYAALIFGAWLYGRLAGPSEDTSDASDASGS